MAFFRNKAFFSPNGEYFAYSSPDGCIKIWETSSNILKQEYTPSSHLSASCSTLAWGPCKKSKESGKAKRSKTMNHVFTNITDLQLVALGTLTGEVLLYSVTNGDLHTQLNGGHNDVVNGISWFAQEDSLFSCSSDQHVVIWTLSTGKVKKKWKADKNPIYSVCVIDSNNVLTSSGCIQWWNIAEQTVIKKFTGHATEVLQLLPVNLEGKSETRYFLSSAVGDRIINAWHLCERNSKNAVVSFCLSDEPEVMELIPTSSSERPLKLAAVTKEGTFHLFEHVLNGKVKKPLEPKVTIRVASAANNCSKPRPIPILASTFSQDLGSCLLVYGNFIKPVFERVEFPKDHQKSPIYLFRDISLPASISLELGVTRIKQPDRPEFVKHLAPGQVLPSKSAYNSSKKRKKKGLDVTELPIQERLNSLNLSKNPEILEITQGSSIKSDSMSHLLVQGLKSQDKDLLDSVLQCADEVTILNTLTQLPIHCISLLIKIIYQRLHKQEHRSHPCMRWLKGLFSVHLPYLMSCDDASQYLDCISQLIEARIEPLPKLSLLKSSIETLLHQCNRINEDHSLCTSKEALVSYQSESSEESEDEDFEKFSTTDNVQDLFLDSSEESESSLSDSENRMEL